MNRPLLHWSNDGAAFILEDIVTAVFREGFGVEFIQAKYPVIVGELGDGIIGW